MCFILLGKRVLFYFISYSVTVGAPSVSLYVLKYDLGLNYQLSSNDILHISQRRLESYKNALMIRWVFFKFISN